MAKSRKTEVPISIANRSDNLSAEDQRYLNDMSRRAPHLVLSRRVPKSEEESTTESQCDILDNFRKKLQGRSTVSD